MAKRPLTARRRRLRAWFLGVGGLVVLFAALVVVTFFLPESTRERDGSANNPRAAGAMALAEVLEAHGVTITQVTTLDAAVERAQAGTTLFIWTDEALSDEAYERLNAVAADVVVTGDLYQLPESQAERFSEGQVRRAYYSPGSDVDLGCDNADAVAAGTMSLAGSNGLEILSGDPTLCFLNYAGYGLYADLYTSHHRVTIIAVPEIFQNSTILSDHGNAALAIRTLGRHDTLTWYLVSSDALPQTDTGSQMEDLWRLMPPAAEAVTMLLLAAAAAAALWQARRFGPLVREPLPVAVPASEVAAGLGLLYRQSRTRGHAAAALRAGSVARLAARLGLPPTASPALVVERVALASGRPPSQLEPLFYGPPPPTDDHLFTLAHQLHQVESEVIRHD
jgi:hypothetical protein